jgi:beta-lactamase superfamily II metal-dependent hydrolase
MRKAAALAAALTVSAAAFSCSSESDSSGGRAQETESTAVEYADLTVTFLDIGKADSIIITGEDSTVVIDCGEKGDGKEIVRFLEEQGTSVIDYLIITHYDKDHVGGAAKVINSFEINNVLAPDYHEYSPEAEKYRTALENKGIEPQLLTADMSFELGGGDYTVYTPKQSYYGPDNDNDFSLVTRLDYNDTSFVFAGDAMDQRLTEVMDIGRCDLLKVPYHGRKLANLGAFIDALEPEYAVVTTSGEDFSPYTQGVLRDKKVQFWSTCYNGRVTAVSDGINISVTCEKGEV